MRTQVFHRVWTWMRGRHRTGVLAIVAVVSIAATVDGVPTYVFNGLYFFCFDILPYDECTFDPIPLPEDGCLDLGLVSNGMGGEQEHWSLSNLSSPNPIYAVAIAVADDVGFTISSSDGVSQDWESQLVTRAQWNAGFTFPGSSGVWAPPSTIGSFDSFFDITYNQAVVYWVSATHGLPLLIGQNNLNFYAGPAQVSSATTLASSPSVAFGDGVAVNIGPSRVGRADQLGLMCHGLGQGMLSVDPGGSLHVSNIGSSGLDGVTVDLGSAGGMSYTTLGQAFLPLGSSFQSRTFGHVTGVPGVQPVITERLDGATTPTGPASTLTLQYDVSPGSLVNLKLLDPLGGVLASFDRATPIVLNLNSSAVAMTFRRRVEVLKSNALTSFTMYYAIAWPVLSGGIAVTDPITGVTYPSVGQVTMSSLAPSPTVDDLTSTEITGVGTGPFQITDESLKKFGVLAHPIGVAKLSSTPGSLLVTNIGSTTPSVASPGNGVSFDVNPSETFMVQWNPLMPYNTIPTPPPSGPFQSAINLRAYGSVGGTSGHSLGTMQIQEVVGGPVSLVQISADYAAVGSTSHQVEVYSGGALVMTIPGVPTGSVGTASAWPGGCGKGAAIVGGVRTACYVLNWPASTTFNIGGLVVAGDELRVLAENPSQPFGHLEKFDIIPTEIVQLELTGMTNISSNVADLNGDGVVNAADLANLLTSWGTNNPAADLNNDGVVDAADLATLLTNWS